MTWSTADIHVHTTCSDGRPAVTPAVGNVHTVFPGRCAADLRAAILTRLTRPGIDRVAHAVAWPGHLAWLTWLQLRRGVLQRSGPVGTPT